MLKRLAPIFALVIGFFPVNNSLAFPFGEGVFGYSVLGDSDNDLVPDSIDPFPEDSSETEDSDSDGIGNNKDPDDDNDGVEDINDGFQFIPLGGLSDADGDGFPDECDDDCIRTGMFYDLDDDNDGVSDIDEIRDGTDPLDPSSCSNCGAILDVDLDGEVGALTDGLLTIRYMFGFTGETLVGGATGSGAKRSASEIEEYLGSLTDR